MPAHGGGEVGGHEAICLLNLGHDDVDVTLTFYFEDRQPQTVLGLLCGGRRTWHLRLDVPTEIRGFEFPPRPPVPW